MQDEGPKRVKNGKEAVVRALLEAENIVIASHESPELDAIGSSVALGIALEKLNKKVWIYNKDRLESCKFLPGYDKVKNYLPNFIPDIFCTVDCATLDRVGKEAYDFAIRTTIVNIDHHCSSDEFGTFNYIDPDASACGILIYELINEMGVEINEDIATNLYAALAKDTMCFLLPTVDKRTMKIAYDIVEKGANLGIVMRAIRYATLKKYKLFSTFISRIQIEDSILHSYLLFEDYEKIGATDEDTEDFIDMVRTIDGVRAVIFVREKTPGNLKVSLRSEKGIDVSEISRKRGGGGHKNAAGFSITCSSQTAKENILKIIEVIKDEIIKQIKSSDAQNF